MARRARRHHRAGAPVWGSAGRESDVAMGHDVLQKWSIGVGAVSAVLMMAAPSGAREDCSTHSDRDLDLYALDTWHSFVKLVVPSTGLPADSIGGALHPDTRAPYTSPTN